MWRFWTTCVVANNDVINKVLCILVFVEFCVCVCLVYVFVAFSVKSLIFGELTSKINLMFVLLDFNQHIQYINISHVYTDMHNLSYW